MASEIDVEGQAGLPIISGRPERSERLALSMTAPARTRWPGRMQTSPTAAWPPVHLRALLSAETTRLSAVAVPAKAVWWGIATNSDGDRPKSPGATTSHTLHAT